VSSFLNPARAPVYQGFDTTNGKYVDDETAHAGAVKVKSTRQARQYMNRKGGFNRPLPAEKSGEKINPQQ
jgi:U4/U6.U5 tri-snRNP-associated protein 3